MSMALGKSSFWAPRWYWIPARVLVVTVVLGLLSLAVSLFIGILGTLAVAWMRGTHPNLTLAYRFAAPVAGLIAFGVLIAMTSSELRRYRQAKALAEIERAA
jgi:hypothetical protein